MPPVREQFEDSGNWLFRRRSFLPFILLVPLIGQMLNLEWPHYGPHAQLVWEMFCICVSVFGLLIRSLTIGHVPARTSGRSTKHLVANSLNTTGIYSVVRHPLYIGNFFLWLGFAMFHPSWQLITIFVLGFWLYYERIAFAEEEFLRRKFPQAFLKWASTTPAIIPRFSGWQGPALPFCWKTAVRREYRAVLGMAVMFFLLDTAGDWSLDRKLTPGPIYVAALLTSAMLYLSIRWIAKRRILHVEGR